MRYRLLVLALACLFPAGDALAAACCVSTTAGGIGRLKLWEEFAVGFASPVSVSVGYWDDEANWRSYSDSYRELEWRPSVYALVRLTERSLASAVVPAVLTARDAASVSDVGGGFGDISLGLRHELVQIGEARHIPGVAVTVAVSAPTGTSPDRATGPLGADTTSRGGAVLSAGVTLEYTWWPWFLQLAASAIVPLPYERADTHATQRFGPGFASSLIGGWEVLDGQLVLTTELRLAWESETVTAGRRIDGSSRVDAGVGVGVAWTLDPHWTLVANLDTGLFASHLGDNAIGRVTPSLSVRYGYF